MQHIEEHREEIEAKYQYVLHLAEEERRSWEERNREIRARIAELPPRADYPEARAKWAAIKAKRGDYWSPRFALPHFPAEIRPVGRPIRAR